MVRMWINVAIIVALVIALAIALVKALAVASTMCILNLIPMRTSTSSIVVVAPATAMRSTLS